MEEYLRQKKEDESYKNKLVEEIEREKKLRLGDRYKAPEPKHISPEE